MCINIGISTARIDIRGFNFSHLPTHREIVYDQHTGKLYTFTRGTIYLTVIVLADRDTVRLWCQVTA